MKKTIKTWLDAMIVHVVVFIVASIALKVLSKLDIYTMLNWWEPLVVAAVIGLVTFTCVRPVKTITNVSDEYLLTYSVRGIDATGMSKIETDTRRLALNAVEKYIEETNFSYNQDNMYDTLNVLCKNDVLSDLQVVYLENTKKSTIVGKLVSNEKEFSLNGKTLESVNGGIDLNKYVGKQVRVSYIYPIIADEASRTPNLVVAINKLGGV